MTMQHKLISIGICHYPGALKSAVYGLEELFLLANRICREEQIAIGFKPAIFTRTELCPPEVAVILLPPSTTQESYLQPEQSLLNWLKLQHAKGSVLASACAGSFIVAATGVAGHRPLTTHWGLAELFRVKFPHLLLDTDRILIDHGDMLTAGGMLSWLDLGLELVARYSSQAVMQKLGKLLVVDTAQRQQRFYQQFQPNMAHNDAAIITLQQTMSRNLGTVLTIQVLANQANITVRTLQRRFVKATGFNPNHYLQRLRIQKACDLLESTTHSFEWIAHQVGYEDPSACRKQFIKVMGLTPKAFRSRFSRNGAQLNAD